MFNALVWGLVQGLTEFLPVSSDGHLILVPAFLNRLGADLALPDLATTAVLHLGTLAALVAYFRSDLRWLARFRHDRSARRVLGLLALGTLPSIAAVFVADEVDRIGDEPRVVAGLLVAMGLVLLVAARLSGGDRRLEESGAVDATTVGLAQVLAILPGISRSGMTITAGLSRGLTRGEAARFGFLLGIPAIAAAGLLEAIQLGRSGGGIPGSLWLGVVVAGAAGYAAIAIFLELLKRAGLLPFAMYCVLVGALGLLVL